MSVYDVSEVGLVKVWNEINHVHIHFTDGTLAESKELDFRLSAGWRVRQTPGEGSCGLWAVWMGFNDLCQRLGRQCPRYQVLLHWMLTPDYWQFIMKIKPMVHGWNMDDYVYQTWFTVQQLDIAALWLGEQYGDGSVRVVYIRQRPGHSSQHDLEAGSVTTEVTAPLIFVHRSEEEATNDQAHFQGFTRHAGIFDQDDVNLRGAREFRDPLPRDTRDEMDPRLLECRPDGIRDAPEKCTRPE